MNTPYERFDPASLILRDELAIDRTLLANERTFLAYARSAVALVLAGLTFVHFSESGWYRVVGVLCVPLGVAVLLFGTRRFVRTRAHIRRVRR